MLVDIYHDNQVIGYSELHRPNAETHIANGTFIPKASYNPDLHADIIEGDYVGLRGQSLKVQSESLGWVLCTSISIQDYSNLLGEIEINLSGISETSYEVHPD
ncbi:hypothetical protein [Sphingorhabdus sp. Alg231-15]|uniref:hypothetical protein n=1 Tax=Sphingorhabdus sp. Alg231-15 TaxID=1922222 RepID=UPI000D5584BD